MQSERPNRKEKSCLPLERRGVFSKLNTATKAPKPPLRDAGCLGPEIPKRKERLEELPHEVRGESVEVSLLGEQGQAVEGQKV